MEVKKWDVVVEVKKTKTKMKVAVRPSFFIFLIQR